MENLLFWLIIGGIVFILVYYVIQKLIKYLSKPEEQLKATSFKCLDGHVVRSKGELIIDNYLHKLGLAHKYEKTIKIKGEKVKYDWYLTDHDIYIEYWGFFGKVNVGKTIISLEKAEDDILKSFGYSKSKYKQNNFV